MSDVLTQPLRFTDPRDLADLRTFATRAKSIDDGAIRLQASGPVLAAYVCVLRPRLLGESTPTILGLRTMALAQPADTDVTVPISAVLDRLARAGENDVELPLPPVTVTESWAGVGAPRTGWEAVGTLQDSALRQSAEAGITEIAAIIPDKPGALIVNNARATVWGQGAAGSRRAPAGRRLRGPHPRLPGRRRTAALPGRTLVPPQRSPRARPGPHRLGTQPSAVATYGAPRASTCRPIPCRVFLNAERPRRHSPQVPPGSFHVGRQAPDGLFTMDSAARSM